MKRVLVVDNDAAVVQLFSRFLTRLGYEVKTAGSYGAAVKVFRPERFGLVILDVELGDGDGVELAKKIQAMEPGVRILLVSGGVEALERARAVGFKTLRKPFDLEELRRMI